MRPQWGAFGARQAGAVSVLRASAAPIERDIAGRARPGRRRCCRRGGTRKLTKRDMLHNDACPKIRVDPQTFDVFVDGELATCEPAHRAAAGAALHAAVTRHGRSSPRAGARRHRRTGRLRQDRADRGADPAASTRRGIDVAVVTNDLVTNEDAERLHRSRPDRSAPRARRRDRRLPAHRDPRGPDAQHRRRSTSSSASLSRASS